MELHGVNGGGFFPYLRRPRGSTRCSCRVRMTGCMYGRDSQPTPRAARDHTMHGSGVAAAQYNALQPEAEAAPVQHPGAAGWVDNGPAMAAAVRMLITAANSSSLGRCDQHHQSYRPYNLCMAPAGRDGTMLARNRASPRSIANTPCGLTEAFIQAAIVS